MMFGGVVGVLWLGAEAVLSSRMSAGVLIQFVFYAIFVAGSAATLSQVWGEVQRAAGATERLMELLDARPAINAPAAARPLPEPPRGSVVLDAVEFQYPSRPGEHALHGFSLAIEPGETVALVGPSGAGKSTVFKLLLRFYDPGSGCVRLDGVDLREADPQAVRSRIGLVPQETVIFAANARENIRYGRPEALDAEVTAAARAAFADDFIQALQERYDSFLGEKGLAAFHRPTPAHRHRPGHPQGPRRHAAGRSHQFPGRRKANTWSTRPWSALWPTAPPSSSPTVLPPCSRRTASWSSTRAGIVATGTHEELMRGGGLYARLASLQFAPEA